MNCKCHGEPAYWQKDGRREAGGHWRCAVKKRAHSLRVDRARADVKNARQRDYHHSPAGGWIVRRKRTLARQRELISERLVQLDQEASLAESRHPEREEVEGGTPR